MIVVKYYINKYNEPVRHAFPDDHICKVLQSGALKIVKLVETDVPDFDENAPEGEAVDMTPTHAITMGLFFGNYTVRRVE